MYLLPHLAPPRSAPDLSNKYNQVTFVEQAIFIFLSLGGPVGTRGQTYKSQNIFKQTQTVGSQELV